jgi:tetratricopeptide (TPR) repeat protein
MNITRFANHLSRWTALFLVALAGAPPAQSDPPLEPLATVAGEVARATSLADKGDCSGALTILREAVSRYENLSTEQRSATATLEALATLHYGIAMIQMTQAEWDGALISLWRALAIDKKLLLREPLSAVLQADVAFGNARVGHVQMLTNDLSGANNSLQRALALHEALLSSFPSDVVRRSMADVLADLGTLRVQENDWQGALKDLLESVRMLEALAATSSADPDTQIDLASTRYITAIAQAATGDRDGSVNSLRDALSALKRLTAQSSVKTEWLLELAGAQGMAALVMQRYLNDQTQALENYQAALDTYRRLSLAAPSNPLWQKAQECTRNTLEPFMAAQHDTTTIRPGYRHLVHASGHERQVPPNACPRFGIGWR